jgi:hypothetical protein
MSGLVTCWEGRPITGLSREELEQAFLDLAAMYKEANERFFNSQRTALEPIWPRRLWIPNNKEEGMARPNNDGIRAVRRETPRIVGTTNDKWSWSKVHKHLNRKPGIVTRIRLLFRPWLTVLAPKGKECAVTTMGGVPLYRYKELNGKAYHLQPEPSPGFPGS